MPIAIDVALALCFLLTMVAGIQGGFFREVFALTGLAAGAWAGLRFTTALLASAPAFLRNSPLVWGVVFVLIVVLVLFLFSLVGRLFAAAWEGKKIPGLSRALGAGLGALRGLILVLVLAGVMVSLAPLGSRTLSGTRLLPWLGPVLRPAAAAALPPPAARRLLDRWEAIPFQHGPARPAPRGEEV